MRCKFAAKPGQIESSVDLAHQMIFGNHVAKVKLVEQLTLVTLQTAHHGSTSPRFASTQRNHGSPHPSMTFATKSTQCGHRRWISRKCCIVSPGQPRLMARADILDLTRMTDDVYGRTGWSGAHGGPVRRA